MNFKSRATDSWALGILHVQLRFVRLKPDTTYDVIYGDRYGVAPFGHVILIDRRTSVQSALRCDSAAAAHDCTRRRLQSRR